MRERTSFANRYAFPLEAPSSAPPPDRADRTIRVCGTRLRAHDQSRAPTADPEKADSTSVVLKHLGQRYVQYINRTYRRSGTLWEGRYRSCLAREDDYILACYRYIEMNPVRAEMVNTRASTVGRAIAPMQKGPLRHWSPPTNIIGP